MRSGTLLCGCVALANVLPPDDGIIHKNGTCYVASDVMFLQDTTGSFMDDMPIVRKQIPGLMERVAREFPGTLFGVAEFRDKPYYPLGELDDFCYKLRYGELTNDAEMLDFAWKILDPSGGGDFYESQYQAGINIVNDQSIGWRPLIEGGYDVKKHAVADPAKLAAAVKEWEEGTANVAGAHVVVLITDAEPHIPGDLAMCKPGAPGWEPSWNCPQNLPANPGTLIDGDPMTTCTDYDYPSEEQFVKAALDNNFLFLFLTTEKVSPFYKQLNEKKFGNPPAFHQTISEDSSNLADVLIQALKAVSEVACDESTSTSTPAPTTTKATTTTPATTTTKATTTTPATTTTKATTTSATTTTPATTTPATTAATSTPTQTTTPVTTTTPATTTSGHVTSTPGSTSECQPCHCEDGPCGCGCDDLVVKVGPSIKKLQLQYEN